MKKNIKIRLPEPQDLNPASVTYLCGLINKVYDDAESGMWKNNAQRVNKKAVIQLLKNKTLLIAEIENQVVGCVNINLFDEHTAEFGMLVADPQYRGIGIGRELVNAAEQWGRDNSRSIMRLELLVPKNWSHPNKEFLKQWYARAGYVLQSTEPFEILHPDKTDHLATPCDFIVYHKDLYIKKL